MPFHLSLKKRKSFPEDWRSLDTRCPEGRCPVLGADHEGDKHGCFPSACVWTKP